MGATLTQISSGIVFNLNTDFHKINSSEAALFKITDSLGKIAYQSPQTEKELWLRPRFLPTGSYNLESKDAIGNISNMTFSVTNNIQTQQTPPPVIDTTPPTLTFSSTHIIFNKLTDNSKMTSSEFAMFSIKNPLGKIVYKSGQPEKELLLRSRLLETGSYTVESTDSSGNKSIDQISVQNNVPKN